MNKRKQRISEQPSAKIKKWKYEDEISFLNKYLCEKKPKAILNEEDIQNVDDEIVSNSDYEGNSEFKSEKGERDHAEDIEQYIVAMDPSNFGM